MKKIVTSLFLISWLFTIVAQESEEKPFYITPAKKAPVASKLDYHLSVGTSFIYAPGYGNGLSTYVAPEISYKLSPKIRVNAGIMFLQSNMSFMHYRTNCGSERSVVIKTPSTISTLAYISGDYLINNRLTLSGTIVKDLSNPGNNAYNNSVQMMSMHLNYKLTDNISIGAGMNMIQSNRNNTFFNPGFNSGNQFSNNGWGY